MTPSAIREDQGLLQNRPATSRATPLDISCTSVTAQLLNLWYFTAKLLKPLRSANAYIGALTMGGRRCSNTAAFLPKAVCWKGTPKREGCLAGLGAQPAGDHAHPPTTDSRDVCLDTAVTTQQGPFSPRAPPKPLTVVSRRVGAPSLCKVELSRLNSGIRTLG